MWNRCAVLAIYWRVFIKRQTSRIFGTGRNLRYAAAMAEYQEPVISTLFEANGYLRNPSGYLGRRFQIYLDLLGEPNQAQVRNYRDDSFIVITPTTAPVIDEIRDAYLAYLLDPLSFKYRKAITDKKPLQKFAEEAPSARSGL